MTIKMCGNCNRSLSAAAPSSFPGSTPTPKLTYENNNNFRKEKILRKDKSFYLTRLQFLCYCTVVNAKMALHDT